MNPSFFVLHPFTPYLWVRRISINGPNDPLSFQLKCHPLPALFTLILPLSILFIYKHLLWNYELNNEFLYVQNKVDICVDYIGLTTLNHNVSVMVVH